MGCEPPAVTGNIAALQTAAYAALPTLRAVMDDKSQLPQQSLGALNFAAEVVNRVLVSLENADDFAKFRRLKRVALKKKVPNSPQLIEAVLFRAGFSAESA